MCYNSHVQGEDLSMIRIIKRKIKSIWRHIDPSEEGKIRRIVKEPPPVKEDLILFTSSEDYSGNPKALFEYMIEHGYNKRYEFVWLFENRDNLIHFDIPNVRSVCMYKEGKRRSFEAQKAALSARYLFYSHNLNWVRNFREEQTYIDLWHGCGYKGELKRDKTKVYYSYLMVTGKKYIDIFRDVMNDPDGNILDLGYPRNEMLFRENTKAGRYLEELKAAAGATKSIIWMPTYRKSPVARLSTDIELGETGLPVLYTNNEIGQINQCCKENDVLLIIKRHHLQTDYTVDPEAIRNIVFVGSDMLNENGADLYEFMGSTDAMLTDYSSAAIDYLLTDKPIGFTLDDFDKYEETRGWSFDNVKSYMPGHHIYTVDDMNKFICDVAEGKDPHAEWRKQILPEMHTYNEGFSKRILEYFGI